MPSTLDVVGSTPIGITGSTGGQRVVPLSALEFNGSELQVRQSWTSAFDSTEQANLLAIAKARKATGELAPPPVTTPTPALLVVATVPGRESNNIVLHVTPDTSGGGTITASTPLKVAVTQEDRYRGLTTAAAAATIGANAHTADTDPPVGTGLVQVKPGPTSDKLPAAVAETPVPSGGLEVKDATGTLLFTLVPRPGLTATQALTAAIDVDTTASTFTVTARYDSAKEPTTTPTVTIVQIGSLPAEIQALVSLSAPPGGAAVPAPTPAAGVPLTGGGPGVAARTVLYTVS